jgi:hypothetical protein
MEHCSLQLFYLTTFYCFKKGLLILQRHSAGGRHKAPATTNRSISAGGCLMSSTSIVHLCWRVIIACLSNFFYVSTQIVCGLVGSLPWEQHSGKSFRGMPLTVKRPSSLSTKNHAVGESFLECRASTRGRFNAVGAIHTFLKKPSFPSATLREEIWFIFKPSSPSATLGEEIRFF